MRTYLKLGSWNVICQVCGFEFKSDDIHKRWDGLLVCKEDFEPRHILDFIRTRGDHTNVPYSNPEPADQFVTVDYVGASYGAADIGAADFAQADVPAPPGFL